MAEDLSTLSNEELFKLCKKSGINAGPITQTTRSVYEKKLRKSLSEVTTPYQLAPAAPLQAPKVIETVPIDVLKPNLPDVLISYRKEFLPEPVYEPETIFAKPATPKVLKEQDKVQIEKSRRSILKNTEQQQQFNEPLFTQEITRQEIIKESTYISAPKRNKSPVYTEIQHHKKVPEKELKMPEFRLLNRPQITPMHEEIIQQSRENYVPNIRKRTATFDKPAVLTDNVPEPETAVETITAGNGGFNFKALILVAIVTALVYFFMIFLQSNPENPVGVE